MLTIEFVRRQRGLSQWQLGVACGTVPNRITQSYISQIERGTGLPTLEQRRRLARVLDVDPDTLLDDVEHEVVAAS